MIIVVATTAIVGDSRGQRDPPEDLELRGAVDARGLENLGADALQRGRQDDHREAGPDPGADDDQPDRVARSVDEEGRGLDPDPLEQAVQRPDLGLAGELVVEHELPDDPGADEADGQGQEEEGLGDRLIPHAVEEDRGDQAADDDEDREQHQPDEAVSQRDERVGGAEEELVVGEADEVRGGRLVLERPDDGRDRWIDEEEAEEEERGQDPEPRPAGWPGAAPGRARRFVRRARCTRAVPRVPRSPPSPL